MYSISLIKCSCNDSTVLILCVPRDSTVKIWRLKDTTKTDRQKENERKKKHTHKKGDGMVQK